MRDETWTFGTGDDGSLSPTDRGRAPAADSTRSEIDPSLAQVAGRVGSLVPVKGFCGAAEEIRTPDPQIRGLALRPG